MIYEGFFWEGKWLLNKFFVNYIFCGDRDFYIIFLIYSLLLRKLWKKKNLLRKRFLHFYYNLILRDLDKKWRKCNLLAEELTFELGNMFWLYLNQLKWNNSSISSQKIYIFSIENYIYKLNRLSLLPSQHWTTKPIIIFLRPPPIQFQFRTPSPICPNKFLGFSLLFLPLSNPQTPSLGFPLVLPWATLHPFFTVISRIRIR